MRCWGRQHLTRSRGMSDLTWQSDTVTTRSGLTIPVRATAQRPTWAQLPAPVRALVEELTRSRVVHAESAGTGFTPGFASRLDLADGGRIFVKAASSADDTLHGWPLSDAYREEVRKLTALPPGIGAPPILWHRGAELDGQQWIIVGFAYVDGTPPRRPWRVDQLRLVLEKLAQTAEALTAVPAGDLEPVAAELVSRASDRLAEVRELQGASAWLDTIGVLCAEAVERTAGGSIVHLDLRDDNILIGSDGQVWFVDWNWPAVGAPWIDLICVLLSARGDGIDVEALIAVHPLTREVDPRSIDSLLAILWSFWAVARTQPVPESSPFLRDHQAWYLEVTEDWLRQRLDQRLGQRLGQR